MEDDINYSTVVFKNKDLPPKEKNLEEPAIYSEVKPEGTVTSVTTEADGKEDAQPRLCPLAVCLVILSVFLVGSITAVIYMSLIVDEQEANLSNLTAENQQLITSRNILQTKTDELNRLNEELSRLNDEQRRLNDKFNTTLSTILKSDNFPVNEYCPQKKCQPCKKNWILFQEKCYMIYLNYPWWTWEDSRKRCQGSSADLVVIDSLQEQEFISNQIQYYFDRFHGYWMGLYKDPNESSDDQKWLWIDGRNDTLKYLVKEGDIGSPGSCVMVIPGTKPSTSWDTADCGMMNRFICEMDPMIWPD